MKPLESWWPSETRSEYLNRLERAETGSTQQLVARIKRSSKYYGQTKRDAWFNVRVVADTCYHLRGNSNNYRLSDVTLGMRLDGGIVVDFSNGKTSN